ncbi:phage tail protein [bacterium]|nr:phage tail protein [bacterium]
MTEFYSIITDKGLELISNALSNGEKLNLEYIAVGDSNGAYYEPQTSQKTLVNEKYRAKISEVNELIVKAQIPNNIGGFYIREVGIFDDKNNLILIAKQPETYKPIIEEGSSKELWIKVLIKAINPDALILKIDTSIQTATVEFVVNLFSNHTHSDLMKIATYDTNYNGIVDTCDYIDGGGFKEDASEIDYDSNITFNSNIYDRNGNGIVDNAENIDAGEF